MIIYKVTNKINGMVYIGQTIRPLKERKYFHINESKKLNPKCYFHKALKKNGIENFHWVVVTFAQDIKELNELEKKCIKEYNSFAPNGYNSTTGGLNYIRSEETRKRLSEIFRGRKPWNLGIPHSEGTKKKIGDAARGENNYNYGGQHTEKTKKKMSENQRGKKNSFYGKQHTEDTKRKISEINKGREGYWTRKCHSEKTKRKMSEARKGKNSHMYGKHHSEETKRKISEANKGRLNKYKGIPLSEETKRKISEALIGYKHSDETKRKMSKMHTGLRTHSKLKKEQVLEIRSYDLTKISKKQIAKQFNVSVSCINGILYRNTWKNI